MGDFIVDEDEKSLDQTSARLFEKSRIKVLQGKAIILLLCSPAVRSHRKYQVIFAQYKYIKHVSILLWPIFYNNKYI
jgi:hypothetical protein